jgi:hypothetical protein
LGCVFETSTVAAVSRRVSGTAFKPRYEECRSLFSFLPRHPTIVTAVFFFFFFVVVIVIII